MLNPISSIQAVTNGLVSSPATPPAAEPPISRPAAESKAVEAKPVEEHLPESKAADALFPKTEGVAKSDAERAKLPIRELSDIQLKYRVNPDTNELTVMVVDKSSHKVIRTIPSEEIKNLSAGDLIQLTS